MSRQFIVFVEGGAKGGLATKCREGFHKFFEKAGLRGKMPRIFACGSRRHAYEDFCIALKQAKPGDFVLLLVDSEAPISTSESQVWHHVNSRQGDQWDKPQDASAEQLHFMVECMEAWFLADKPCLAGYFGQGFKPDQLPRRDDIERVSKADINNGLKRATENSKKGRYDKGKHSFDLLGQIDPAKVAAASPYAQRLIATLTARA